MNPRTEKKTNSGDRHQSTGFGSQCRYGFKKGQKGSLWGMENIPYIKSIDLCT